MRESQSCRANIVSSWTNCAPEELQGALQQQQEEQVQTGATLAMAMMAKPALTRRWREHSSPAGCAEWRPSVMHLASGTAAAQSAAGSQLDWACRRRHQQQHQHHQEGDGPRTTRC